MWWRNSQNRNNGEVREQELRNCFNYLKPAHHHFTSQKEHHHYLYLSTMQ
jgi:hypothetical protein